MIRTNETSPFGPEKDRYFMAQALAQARKAFACNEVPVGAVIVDAAGQIIARAYNKVEKSHTQTAHAEMHALTRACKKIGNWRGEGLWLYVTLEPCSMCMHLILLSRISGVVFGAASPSFGYHLDKAACLAVYKREALKIVPYCSEESKQLLQCFFQLKRKEGECRKKRKNGHE
jgi:tRNA(adenine34) deaminase